MNNTCMLKHCTSSEDFLASSGQLGGDLGLPLLRYLAGAVPDGGRFHRLRPESMVGRRDTAPPKRWTGQACTLASKRKVAEVYRLLDLPLV